MQLVFQGTPNELGTNETYVKWSRDSHYIAYFGSNDMVIIADRK